MSDRRAAGAAARRGEGGAPRAAAPARCARRASLIGGDRRRLLGRLRDLRQPRHAVRPDQLPRHRDLRAPVVDVLVRHRPARPRRLLARARRLARHPDRRAARDAARHRRSAPRSASSPATSAASSTTSSAASIDAVLALPLIIVAVTALAALGSVELDGDDRDRRSSSRRSSRAPCAPPCSPSATSTTSRRRGCAASGRLYVMFVEILPNVLPVDPRRGDRPARLRDLRGRRRSPSSASAIQPPSPGLGACRSPTTTTLPRSGLVDGAVPGARDRVAGRRRQPRRRRRRSRCSSDERSAARAGARARRRSTSSTACAASIARCCAASRSTIERGRVVRPRRRVGLRQVDGGARDRALPAAQRARSTRARSGSTGATSSALSGAELRRAAREQVSMVYQNPGAALNPSIKVGPQVAEVVHGARRAARRGARARARRARARADRRPGLGARSATRTSSPAACSSAS